MVLFVVFFHMTNEPNANAQYRIVNQVFFCPGWPVFLALGRDSRAKESIKLKKFFGFRV